jgi:hypothetical protein
MEPWKDGSVLLRFEHIFEYNEDKDLSIPVVIDIQVSFYNQLVSLCYPLYIIFSIFTGIQFTVVLLLTED